MSNGDWKRRCADLELEHDMSRALSQLIPIWALERGQNWIPSEDAIRLLKKWKDSIRDYDERYHSGQ